MAGEDVQMDGTTDEKSVAEIQSAVPAASAIDGDVKMLDGAGEGGDDSEKMERAVRQVEFYFADANLPFDRFMWTLHTQNPEHWVPLETVASFKRMGEYKALGIPRLADALRKQSTELEVDEAGIKIRRTTEVKEPKGQFERSVYAKGFPDEDPSLQMKLERFFAKYGKVNAVRMRRDQNKKFKNSIFAEFTDFSSVEKFLNADPKPSWDGKELIIMSKEAYCNMKIKEKGLTGKSAEFRRETMISRGFNAFREMNKDKKATESVNGNTTNGTVPVQTADNKTVWLEFMGSKIKVHTDEEGNGTVKPEDVPLVKGSTLRFEGCGGNVNWSEIKEPLKMKFDWRPPYIKYTKGEDAGLVGFHKALSEEEIATVREAVKTLNGKEVKWSLLLEDEEEKAFQIERAQKAAKSVMFMSSNSGRGRGGFRGGFRGGRGRGGGRRDRDRNTEKAATSAEVKGNDGDEKIGEKRKRAVEPDGGPDVGVRGNAGPPAIVASEPAGKKVKVDGEP